MVKSTARRKNKLRKGRKLPRNRFENLWASIERDTAAVLPENARSRYSPGKSTPFAIENLQRRYQSSRYHNPEDVLHDFHIASDPLHCLNSEPGSMQIEENNLSDEGLNETALGMDLREDGTDSENEYSQGEDQGLSGDYADCARKNMMNWQTLVAILAITGTNRMTVAQFGFFRDVVNFALETDTTQTGRMPSYSTLKRRTIPLIQKNGYAIATDHILPLDPNVAGAKSRSASFLNLSSETPTVDLAPVRIVMPSEWAKKDVQFKPTWDLLKKGGWRGQKSVMEPAFSCIEESLLASGKDRFVHGVHTAIFSDETGLYRSVLSNTELVEIWLRDEPNLADLDGIESNIPLPIESRGISSNIVLKTKLVVSRLVKARRDSCSVTNEGIFFEYENEISAPKTLWRAGDICTFLDLGDYSRHVCLLVHRQVKAGYPDFHLLLIWIPQRESLDGRLNLDLTNAVTQKAEKVIGASNSLERPMLLPSQPYQDKQGSAGGVYMLPLNLHPSLRRNRRGVRVLGLTPPGVSTSQVFNAIVEDLVRAATTGIETVDADGESLLVFIQVVGYVGDYVEIAYLLDVIGHKSTAPCHLCTFVRLQKDQNCSRFGYSTNVHSADSSSFRSGPRTAEIRKANHSDEVLRKIGLEPSSSSKVQGNSLFQLHEKLSEAFQQGKTPLAICGHRIMDASFDPYRSVLVAPDHLLAGNAINVLNAAFLVLPSDQMRIQVDANICQSLRENSLVTQRRVYSMSDKTLYSTTLSGTFCTLFVAAPVFVDTLRKLRTNVHPEGTMSLETLSHAVQLISDYSSLVSKTYWVPDVMTDGTDALDSFNRDAGTDHINKLGQRAVSYIQDVDLFCSTSDIARKHLDKPNLHRLLELFLHSIPGMGHLRNFSELLFEFTHQPLKRAIARSNHREPQLQAMSHALADEWRHRLALAITRMDEKENTKQWMYGTLSQLLTGVSESSNANTQQSHLDIDEKEKLLIPPVISALLDSHSPTTSEIRQFSTTTWELYGRSQNTNLQHIYNSLLNECILSYQGGNGSVHFFEKARLGRARTKGGRTAKPAPHDMIRPGHAVQCLVRKGNRRGICDQPSYEDILREPKAYELRILLVEALVSFTESEPTSQYAHSSPYAIVSSCVIGPDNLIRVEDPGCTQILVLNGSVRRVALQHACSKSESQVPCIVDKKHRGVNHNESFRSGGTFYYYGRADGYPPRMA